MRLARSVRPAALAVVTLVLPFASPVSRVEARITRLEVTRVEPAFGGQAFGTVGGYERIVGRAHGEVGGIRSLHLQVPVGTYTGWNLGRAGRFEDGFCSLQGSFVPFARTRAERVAIGDPRPSLEERYPTRDAYVEAVRRAADGLVARRLLLPADAAALVAEAERDGIRLAP